MLNYEIPSSTIVSPDTTPFNYGSDPWNNPGNCRDGNSATYADGTYTVGGTRSSMRLQPVTGHVGQGILTGIWLDYEITVGAGGFSHLDAYVQRVAGTTLNHNTFSLFGSRTQEVQTLNAGPGGYPTWDTFYVTFRPEDDRSAGNITTVRIYEVRFLYRARGEVSTVDG